ncbi:hypothetical protein CEXT_745271 [Caerostris extrusa]|uniref:Uncharacterized protein n=1 Tax=Caerostris extrusa TaxID=172846 RepID=A0AAV4VBZ3_CAEEX|nr:hypothetical protein CEXT_745271 [Caerostris extrusa]
MKGKKKKKSTIFKLDLAKKIQTSPNEAIAQPTWQPVRLMWRQLRERLPPKNHHSHTRKGKESGRGRNGRSYCILSWELECWKTKRSLTRPPSTTPRGESKDRPFVSGATPAQST